MDMKFSEKAEQLDAGIFAVLNEKKNELVKQGRTIYNLSVGTPDFPPMPHIMEAVSEAAKRPENYKYALSELPELLDADDLALCFQFVQHVSSSVECFRA